MHGQEAYVDKEVKFKTANYYAAHAASHAAHTDTLQSLGPHLLNLAIFDLDCFVVRYVSTPPFMGEIEIRKYTTCALIVAIHNSFVTDYGTKTSSLMLCDFARFAVGRTRLQTCNLYTNSRRAHSRNDLQTHH
nr:hypothetical protein Itr_chr01CG19780 [Ipomoea trifida]